MIPSKRYARKHAKARKRRYLKAQERQERDRRQARQAAEALEQALHGLGLPEHLVAEIEDRLRSQQKPAETCISRVRGSWAICRGVFARH